MNNEELGNLEEETKEEAKLPKKKKKDDKLLKEIEQLKNECTLKDEKILRITAEMQNIKRRSEEDRMKLLKYDGETVILKMITILDNFEHAIKMDDNDLTDELSKFLSGFKMIYDGLLEILHNKGITEIEVLDKTFDPTIMNAVLTETNKEKENNIVLDVLQKGYMYHDKLIRPAMVKVNERESE